MDGKVKEVSRKGKNRQKLESSVFNSLKSPQGEENKGKKKIKGRTLGNSAGTQPAGVSACPREWTKRNPPWGMLSPNVGASRNKSGSSKPTGGTQITCDRPSTSMAWGVLTAQDNLGDNRVMAGCFQPF